MTSDQIYGVTPPMNVYLPTEHEKHLTDTLIQELKRENTFETPAGIEQRYVPSPYPNHTITRALN